VYKDTIYQDRQLWLPLTSIKGNVFSVARNADGIESARYCAMFTSFSDTRNAAGIESARPWSILPVSNNIAELPGLDRV